MSGFDENDLFAEVPFTVHPRTGMRISLLDDEMFIGEDSETGGGSEAGPDASVEYDLGGALAGYEPYPQGFSVECDPPATTATTLTTTVDA